MPDRWSDDEETFERIRRDWQQGSAMPTGSDRQRNKGKKQTARGRRKQRQVGKQTGGLRKRRLKRID